MEILAHIDALVPLTLNKLFCHYNLYSMWRKLTHLIVNHGISDRIYMISCVMCGSAVTF